MAERRPRSVENYLTSFAGFVSVEDLQVFAYVVVDTPNYPPGGQQAHSSYVGAVFSKIITGILPYLNIFPTKDLPENGVIQENLPSPKDINEPVSETGDAEGTEETPAETRRQYETDGHMPGGEKGGGAGSDVSDAVPTMAGDGNGERTGPSFLPVKAPPRQPNENSTQTSPAGGSTQITEPSSTGEIAKPSE